LEKLNIKKQIVATNTAYIANLICQHLQAASKWLFSQDRIDKHYLENLAHDLPSGRNKPEPKPFSKEQKQEIISAFWASARYCYYSEFVTFLFETGCRPCEAIGLQWQDVDLDKKQIKLGRSSVRLKNGSEQVRDSSKNGNNRIFPMNENVINLFDRYRQGYAKCYDKVFPTPEGLAINLQSFRRNAWTKILDSLGIDSAKYTVYSCRDTFITLALEQGIDVRTIAKLCDNSPQIIYKHYAGWTKEIPAINFN